MSPVYLGWLNLSVITMIYGIGNTADNMELKAPLLFWILEAAKIQKDFLTEFNDTNRETNYPKLGMVEGEDGLLSWEQHAVQVSSIVGIKRLLNIGIDIVHTQI